MLVASKAAEYYQTMNILLAPDGHRRWARQNDVSYDDSYEIACQKIVDICQYLGDRAISSQLWLAVSTPFNNERPESEVTSILDAALGIRDMGAARGVAINTTANGRLDLLPDKYAALYAEQEKEGTPGGFTLHQLLGWAVNTEVTTLAREFQADPSVPVTHAALVERSAVKEHIDLVVRTGTEGRLSGMVPWHSTDAELAFSTILFPDYTLEDFAGALEDYDNRDPRNSTWPMADI